MAKKKQGKAEKKQGKIVRICTRCKSKNLAIDNTNKLVPARGLPTVYVCEDCGYKLPFFLKADEKSAKKLVEETKKIIRDPEFDRMSQNRTETSYGIFLIKFWWLYVSGPLLIVLGFFVLVFATNLIHTVLGGALLVSGVSVLSTALYLRFRMSKKQVV